MHTTLFQTCLVTTALFALTCAAGPLHAQSSSENRSVTNKTEKQQASSSQREQRREATASKRVKDAESVVSRMEKEPKVKEMLQQAKGVFIVPSYGRAAAGVGGSGGSGVLLARHEDGSWSDPAFYQMGEIDIGIQAGGEAGPLALILTNDKALDRFRDTNRFSLEADSGITVVDWSKLARGETGPGDVVAWSGTKGLFGDLAAVGVSDLRFNRNLTQAYYGKSMMPKEILAEKGSDPKAEPLRQALATGGMAASGSSSGSSSGGSSGGSTGASSGKASGTMESSGASSGSSGGSMESSGAASSSASPKPEKESQAR